MRPLRVWPLLVVLLAFASTAQLPGAAGPTFRIDASDLPAHPVFIAYGDTRFTDWRFAGNVSSPWARRALVEKIASEKPDALFLTGDLPFQGAQMGDYRVFQRETESWTGLRIFPVLGNHEFYSRDFLSYRARGLANWWKVFPALKDRRWYSVQLGQRVYALCLDSNFGALRSGSRERVWIDQQLSALPADDQFRSKDLNENGRLLPNYHYVKFELERNALNAAMIRISNPEAPGSKAKWNIGEKFSIPGRK